MSLNEIEIEKELQEKGLNAPRLNPTHIKSKIVKSEYTLLQDGRTTICLITLVNGFTITGKSACVSKENYDEEIGNKIAYEDAVDKIWQLEAYLLQESLYNQA